MSPGRGLVVHIITRLEPGGSARNTVDSCAGQAADYDVVLAAGPHPGSAELLKLLPPGVNCVEIPALQRELSPRKDLAALLQLRRALLRLDPDIIHTHTSKAGALGRLAAALAWPLRRRALVIHTPHGHLLYGYYGRAKTFLFRQAEVFLAGLTDILVALTAGERDESLAAGIGRPEQWRVVHSGVDFAPPPAAAHKHELGVPAGEVAVGTIARLEPVKGVESFVRAAALLKHADPELKIKFVVIGGGALEGKLRALAARLGAAETVIFAGHRPDARALLPALDIYVQPSLNEGMGRAPLEAQAQGLPVIVSEVCGLPETIKPGVTGIRVKPGDAEGLAAAVKMLALSPQLRARMGAAARAWTASADETGHPRFGVAAMNARLKALYREALSAAARKAG